MTRSPRTPLRVSVIQVSAGRDRDRNWARLQALLSRTPPSNLIALPEVFSLRAADADYRRGAEPIPGPTTRALAAIAHSRKCWILAGSIIERDKGKTFNTSVLINRSGRIAAVYRKIHLFEARLEDGRIIREQDAYEAGHKPVMAGVDGWSCGLAICYDLRFPELFRRYMSRGAHLLFIPSNFTQRTGKDHWEILVRARAIENQCFVIAPNQCGRNPVSGVASHGHSLVVGPWGEILGSLKNAEGVLTVDLHPDTMRQVRKRIPALTHHRFGRL